MCGRKLLPKALGARPPKIDHLARFWKTATLRATKMRVSFPITIPVSTNLGN